MAVTEDADPCGSAQPSGTWLCDPVLPSSAVTHLCTGCFRQRGTVDVVVGRGDSLELLAAEPGSAGGSGAWHLLCRQPADAVLLDVRTLDASRQSALQDSVDQLVLLSDAGYLSCLKFSISSNRFLAVSHVLLNPAGGIDRFRLGRLLAVAPDGQAVAVAAFHSRLAILSVDAAAADPLAAGTPVVYAGGQSVQVHGAMALAGDEDDAQAVGLQQGLGTIWDMCFMHTAVGAVLLHLAVLTHRADSLASELQVLQFNSCTGSIHSLCSISLPHARAGGGALVGTPLHVTAIPSYPTGLVVIGSQCMMSLSYKVGHTITKDAPMPPESIVSVVDGMGSGSVEGASSEAEASVSGSAMEVPLGCNSQAMSPPSSAPASPMQGICVTPPSTAPAPDGAAVEQTATWEMASMRTCALPSDQEPHFTAFCWQPGSHSAPPRLAHTFTGSNSFDHLIVAQGSKVYCLPVCSSVAVAAAAAGSAASTHAAAMHGAAAAAAAAARGEPTLELLPMQLLYTAAGIADVSALAPLAGNCMVAVQEPSDLLLLAPAARIEPQQQPQRPQQDIEEEWMKNQSLAQVLNQHEQSGVPPEQLESLMQQQEQRLEEDCRHTASISCAATHEVRTVLAGMMPPTQCVVADLLDEKHPQVYCTSSSPGSGIQAVSLSVPAPDLHTSQTHYPGVTGIWAVPGVPGATHHALVVLSFADSSRALSTGAHPASDALADVSDTVGLCTAEATLECGCVGEGVAAQVTPNGVHLCLLEPRSSSCAHGDQQGGWRQSPKQVRHSREDSDGGSNDTAGRTSLALRLAEVAVLSSPVQQQQQIQQQHWQQQHESISAVPAMHAATADAASMSVDGSGVYLEHTNSSGSSSLNSSANVGAQPSLWHWTVLRWQQQQQQQLQQHSSSPLAECAVKVVLAAMAPGLVIVALSHVNMLLALRVAYNTAIGSTTMSATADAPAAAQTLSRKRGRSSWQLQEAGMLLHGRQLSCLHMCSMPGGGYWLLTGSYDGCIDVVQVPADGSGMTKTQCLLPGQLRVQPSSAAAVPHSLQSLPGTAAGALTFAVGFRDGTIGLYELATPSSSADALPAPPRSELRVLSAIEAGSSPVRLELLPAAQLPVPGPSTCSTQVQLLAVGEQVWLVSIPAVGRRLVLQRLGVGHVLHAGVVVLPPATSGSADKEAAAEEQPVTLPAQQQERGRLVLLCALEEGQLQLAALPDGSAGSQLPQAPRTLLPGVTVHMLLHHTASSKLLAIGQAQSAPGSPSGSADASPDTPSTRYALHCVDPASGGQCCSWAFDRNEQPQSMCLWDADATAFYSGTKLEPAAAAASSSSTARLQLGQPGLHEGTDALPPAAHGFAASILHKLHSSMRVPPASSAQQRPLSHPCGLFTGPHVGVGQLVVVGTRRADGHAAAAPACLGHMLVLQLLAAPMRDSSSVYNASSSQSSRSGSSSASSSIELERWTSEGTGRRAWALRLLARLRMPDPVWAVAAYSASTVVASVGHRLVLYSLAGGRLKKLAVQPVLGQVTSLSCDRASGVIVAVDRSNGLACYRYLVPKGSSQPQEQTLHVVSAHASGPQALLACTALPGGAAAALADDGTFIHLGAAAAETGALPCGALQLQASHKLRALALSMHEGGCGVGSMPALYVPTLLGSVLRFTWVAGRDGALLGALHDAAAAVLGSLTSPARGAPSRSRGAVAMQIAGKGQWGGNVADGALLWQLLTLPRGAQLQTVACVLASCGFGDGGSAVGVWKEEEVLLFLQRFLCT